MHPEPIELSGNDFLQEIRIAPKWNIFQYYQQGHFELIVFYSFGTWIYRSPSMINMGTIERGNFYGELRDTIRQPTIAEAKEN